MESQSSYYTQLALPPWVVLAVGYFVGQTSRAQDALLSFYAFVDKGLVPIYTLLVILYLTSLIWQRIFARKKKRISRRETPSNLKDTLETAALSEAEVVEDQPCDLTGAYKLVSLENFDGFLEAQGVPWALRIAACKARPVHRITHKGNRITIKIEGIIETQTTYIIDGPPVDIQIRGRIFRDQYTYLESGDGIKGIKKAITENYDVFVERRLAEDGQTLTLVSKAVFQDGSRDAVECTQIFERIE